MSKISFANHISWQVLPSQQFAFAYNLKTKQYYKFEETALVIWSLIAEYEPITYEKLITETAAFYDIERENIESDINEFLTSLLEKGLIEYNGSHRY